TGSAASRGAVAQALTSTGSTHANAHLTHPRARRMPVSPPTGLRHQTRASAPKQPTRAGAAGAPTSRSGLRYQLPPALTVTFLPHRPFLRTVTGLSLGRVNGLSARS